MAESTMHRAAQRRIARLVLILALFSSLLFFVSSMRGVNAAGTLTVSPTHANLMPVGTKFTIGIRVANMDPFDGWDIQVAVSNESIINATDISLAGSVLSPIYTAAHCVNGGEPPNNICVSAEGDGQGIVHSAIVSASNTTQRNGLLFSITYQVVGVGFSKISIIRDDIANGGTTTVSHTTVDGTYGSKPTVGDFSMSPDSSSLAVTQGLAINSTITLSSLNNFNGTVILSVNATLGGVLAQDIALSLRPPSVHVSNANTNDTILSIFTSNKTAISSYVIYVTGRTSGTLPAHYLKLTLTVQQPPNYYLTASSTLVRMHEQDTNSTIIQVQSQRGYANTIQLNTTATFVNSNIRVPGLIATLKTYTVNLSAGQTFNDALTISTPLSSVNFTYSVIVTATSSDRRSQSLLVKVIPPTSDFTFSPSSLQVSVNSGGSTQLSVSVSSQDYFEGVVYLFAESSSGTRLSFFPTTIPICIVHRLVCSNRTENGTSTFTLTVDASLISGDHYVTLRATSILPQSGLTQTHEFNVTFLVSGAARSSDSSNGLRTILGLQPLAYFGLLSILGVALGVAAVFEKRPPRSVIETLLSNKKLSLSQRAKIEMEHAVQLRKKRERPASTSGSR